MAEVLAGGDGTLEQPDPAEVIVAAAAAQAHTALVDGPYGFEEVEIETGLPRR